MSRQNDTLFVNKEGDSAIVQCYCGTGQAHGQLEFFMEEETWVQVAMPAVYGTGIRLFGKHLGLYALANLFARTKAAWRILRGKRLEHDFQMSMSTACDLSEWLDSHVKAYMKPLRTKAESKKESFFSKYRIGVDWGKGESYTAVFDPGKAEEFVSNSWKQYADEVNQDTGVFSEKDFDFIDLPEVVVIDDESEYFGFEGRITKFFKESGNEGVCYVRFNDDQLIVFHTDQLLSVPATPEEKKKKDYAKTEALFDQWAQKFGECVNELSQKHLKPGDSVRVTHYRQQDGELSMIEGAVGTVESDTEEGVVVSFKDSMAPFMFDRNELTFLSRPTVDQKEIDKEVVIAFNKEVLDEMKSGLETVNEIKAGDKVTLKNPPRKKKYVGTVTGFVEDKAQVFFTNDSKPHYVAAEDLELYALSGGPLCDGKAWNKKVESPYRPDDKVLIQTDCRQKEKGKVVKVHSNGMIGVEFDDKTVELYEPTEVSHA